MKRLLFVFVIALSATQATADATNTVTWEAFGLSVGGVDVDFIDLDVEIGNNYVLLFGSIDFFDGFSTPATGSCFFPSGDLFLFCNLAVGENSIVLSINDDFDGTAESIDADGFVIDDGFLTFLGII